MFRYAYTARGGPGLDGCYLPGTSDQSGYLCGGQVGLVSFGYLLASNNPLKTDSIMGGHFWDRK